MSYIDQLNEIKAIIFNPKNKEKYESLLNSDKQEDVLFKFHYNKRILGYFNLDKEKQQHSLQKSDFEVSVNYIKQYFKDNNWEQ